MHILNDQAIFDAALARMLTQSDQGKPIITPEAPVIHQPVLVKAPEQRVTADGAYIRGVTIRYESEAPMYSIGGALPTARVRRDYGLSVEMDLLMLGNCNEFLAAARAGRMVRMVFSGDG